MFGRHLTKGFSWILVVALLLTSVTVAAAQPGDENPGKPPAPPEEPISQIPDVTPPLPDNDPIVSIDSASTEASPLWSIAGNFTIRDFLGVGTEAPSTKIHAIHNVNGSASVRVDNTNAGNAAMSRLILYTANDRTLQIQKFGNGYSTTWNGLSMANWARVRVDPAVPGMVITTGGPYPLVFGTGDIERARVTPAGNLLVGTRSDDTHRVTVKHTTNDNVMRLIGPDAFGSGARLNFGDGDYVYLDEDLDDKLTIYASGRTALMGGPVGVGTTSPVSGSKLDVESSGSIGTYSRANSTTGTNYGVYGQVNNTDSIGVAGFQPGYGYGDKSTWFDPGGFFGGTNGVVAISKYSEGAAVVGHAQATSGSRVGVRGEVGGTGYGLFTTDNIYVGGNCVGCAMAYIAHNASQETLTTGDVVAVRGVGKTLQGQTTPVLEVGRATAKDTYVLGVIYMRGQFYANGAGSEAAEETVQPVEGDAAPGDYLLVITGGLAQVRIDQKDALAPGAALTVSDVSGSARVADGAATLVFGQAMEAQPNEKGLIWAMIETQ